MANILNYIKTVWRAGREGGTAWTPERLNNIENGIEQATNQINQNSEDIDKLDESVDTLNTDLLQLQNKFKIGEISGTTNQNGNLGVDIPAQESITIISAWCVSNKYITVFPYTGNGESWTLHCRETLASGNALANQTVTLKYLYI